MTEYNKDGEVSLGCETMCKARGEYKGELSRGDLSEIDDVMLELGSQRTGTRIDVSSTKFEQLVTVEYVYQESIMSRSLSNAVEKLEAFTELESPEIFVQGTSVQYKQ